MACVQLDEQRNHGENEAMRFDIISLAQACVTCQCSAAEFIRLAAQLGIEPSCRIGNVDHYDAGDVDQIATARHGYVAPKPKLAPLGSDLTRPG